MSIRPISKSLVQPIFQSLEERLQAFLHVHPSIHPEAYIAKSALLLGAVRIGKHCSLWPFVAARGDLNYIAIGDKTNIQEGAVLHLAENHPLLIGKGVTVGHKAILHACTVEDHCLIGMQATVLDGATIGEGSIIGAAALVPQGMRVPPRSLVLGIPGRIVRQVSDAEYAHILESAHLYLELAKAHQALKDGGWFS